MILMETGKKFPAGSYFKKLPLFFFERNADLKVEKTTTFLKGKLSHVRKAKFYKVIHFQIPLRRLSGIV